MVNGSSPSMNLQMNQRNVCRRYLYYTGEGPFFLSVHLFEVPPYIHSSSPCASPCACSALSIWFIFGVAGVPASGMGHISLYNIVEGSFCGRCLSFSQCSFVLFYFSSNIYFIYLKSPFTLKVAHFVFAHSELARTSNNLTRQLWQ